MEDGIKTYSEPGPALSSNDIAREPTYFELQNDLYSQHLNRLGENMEKIINLANKLGVDVPLHETIEDKPTAQEVPQNLLSHYDFNNGRFSRVNDLLERYVRALEEAI